MPRFLVMARVEEGETWGSLRRFWSFCRNNAGRPFGSVDRRPVQSCTLWRESYAFTAKTCLRHTRASLYVVFADFARISKKQD